MEIEIDGLKDKIQEEMKELHSKLSIHMYDIPPTQDYSLSKTCQIAEERMMILKGIQGYFEARKDDTERDLSFYDGLEKKFISLTTKYRILDDPLTDRLSHWILKLAFTNQEQEEFFFTFYEKILYAARIYSEAKNAVGKENTRDELDRERNIHFFKKLCDYSQIDFNKFTFGELSKKGNKIQQFDINDPYILVPYRFAIKSMDHYDVVLIKGKACVNPYNAFIVLQELFEETLSIHRQNLLRVSGYMLKQEPRLDSLSLALRKFKEQIDKNAEIFFDKKEKFNGIVYENLNNIANQHFPLCMLEIYDNFKQIHTMKHWGRLQFGMFLKGVGMDIKDTIRFFSNELKKSAQGEKKVKEYQYYIEHMYGKQGKKTDYTPWSCQKVAGKNIPTGNEVYGCPFKFYSDNALKQTLEKKKGLSAEDIEEILADKKTDYTLGCKKLFEKTHPGAIPNKGLGRHPNSYFSSSYWASQKRKTIDRQSD